MDKIDMLLNLDLIKNSRISYRTLADKYDLSVNAVHKRIKNNVESGIIKNFTSKISLKSLNAFQVVIFGKSKSSEIEKNIQILGKNKKTYQIVIAAGNYLYISGYLQDISELDTYSSFIIKEGNIEKPTIGLISQSKILNKDDINLKKLDYKIIYSLHKNSRKKINDIADEIKVSSKTIKRYLSKMIEEGSIELSIDFYPTVSNDIFTFYHMTLNENKSNIQIAKQILKKYYPRVIGAWTFSNLPNQILMNIWTNTISEIHDFENELKKKDYVQNIFSNMLYDFYYFDTWRDELLIKKIKG